MIYIPETFKSAITALSLNKVRTFLTMLGVTIGVFSVVALVSVVQGFQNYITDQFNALGSNLVLVTPSIGNGNQDPSRAFTGNKLTFENVDTIERSVGEKITAATVSIRIAKTIKFKTKSYDATLVGGNYRSAEIFDLNLSSGSFFTKNDDISGLNKIVIGSDVQQELFGDRNSIGEVVKIDGEPFEIVGALAPKSTNFDDRVFLPASTIKKDFGIDTVSSIAVKVKEGWDINEVMREVKIALLKDMKNDDFSVVTQKDILSSIDSILSVLSAALAAIAGISLLVGGIGIMNIMLVSVTERTQEIGLRKALGATSKNIGIQFLSESIIISLGGGLVGLALGYLGAYLIRDLIRATVPWWAVVAAMGFSIIVGVAFGTYPALSASKRDPIEALRFE